jgi:hypothetical protein
MEIRNIILEPAKISVREVVGDRENSGERSSKEFTHKTIKSVSIKSQSNSSSLSESNNTENNAKVITKKQKQKRVITNTNKWIFSKDDFYKENQINILKKIQTDLNNLNTHTHESISDDNIKLSCVLQQLNKKIAGYKTQDIQKNLYTPEQFVNTKNVVNILLQNELTCYYCKHTVQVIYENVREPLQWTLDRIDNTMGHNTTNILIACLTCNIRRKTIYHERYLFTKECEKIVKL